MTAIIKNLFLSLFLLFFTIGCNNDNNVSPIQEPIQEPTTYSWNTNIWSTCTGDCGTNNATQTRTVTCVASTGESVADGMCSTTKPTTTQACTASICPTPTPVNNAPTLSTTFSNISLVENSGTTNYEINVSDIDGDALILTVESNNTSIITTTQNWTGTINQARYSTALDFDLRTVTGAFGLVKITITLSDGQASTTTSFDVNVLKKFESGDTWKGLVYNTTISTVTNRIWLDRNLGASIVCTNNATDNDCYGDYYQWGRETDGHEKLNSTVTILLATDLNTSLNYEFITSSLSPFDWVASGVDDDGSLRSANWSKTDGSSICPVGYRVPTIEEFIAENISNSGDAFTKLKLPFAGQRQYATGQLVDNGYGHIWSSSPIVARSQSLNFDTNGRTQDFANRSFAQPVRCINDNNPPTIDTTFSDISLVENNGTTNYEINVSDIDEDTLTLTVESNNTSIITVDQNWTNSLAKADYDGKTLDFNLTTLTDAFGLVKITINLSDDNGENNITKSFDVNVTEVVVTHNGITYGIATSPNTGKVWLDRNLGASQVCTALDDTLCYGDYYQWGRNTDGHEKSTSNTKAVANIDINDAGTDFITPTVDPYDWTGYDVDGYPVDENGALRSANWSKTDGTSICPIGYRVPTKTELLDETTGATTPIASNADAFNSFLKLPSAGERSNDGSFSTQGSTSYIWTSSPNSTFGSESFYFMDSNAGWSISRRANGRSVRCLKD